MWIQAFSPVIPPDNISTGKYHSKHSFHPRKISTNKSHTTEYWMTTFV